MALKKIQKGPLKNSFAVETWKLEKTLFEIYQNNTVMGIYLKKQFLYSFSFQNVPLL